MKDYEIINSVSPEELAALVAKKLRAGWKLHGSPFALPVTFEEHGLVNEICQAMVHERIKHYALEWERCEGGIVTTDGQFRIVRQQRDYNLFIADGDQPVQKGWPLEDCKNFAEIIWAEDTM